MYCNLTIIFITHRIGATEQNGFQIRILYRKIHKKVLFLYTIEINNQGLR